MPHKLREYEDVTEEPSVFAAYLATCGLSLPRGIAAGSPIPYSPTNL